jgi:two-component system, response regulator, stage 0 sporulation protein F
MSGKTKILYIDDEEVNLQLFEYHFSAKYDVIIECCGLNGLDCLEKYPDIKVVISDMKMPQMTGLEFVSIAKEKYRNKIYFILTGYWITDEIKMAIESKLIANYFSKPFNKNDLEIAIDKAINAFNS